MICTGPCLVRVGGLVINLLGSSGVGECPWALPSPTQVPWATADVHLSCWVCGLVLSLSVFQADPSHDPPHPNPSRTQWEVAILILSENSHPKNSTWSSESSCGIRSSWQMLPPTLRPGSGLRWCPFSVAHSLQYLMSFSHAPLPAHFVHIAHLND